MNNKETSEHRQFCKWLQIQHPDILFISDFYSFLSQQNRYALNSMRKTNMPDIFIAEPKGEYKGLFIEIKKTGETLYKKNGEFKTEHLENQWKTMQQLENKGYYCEFGLGFDNCVRIATEYLNL